MEEASSLKRVRSTRDDGPPKRRRRAEDEHVDHEYFANYGEMVRRRRLCHPVSLRTAMQG